MNGIFEAFLMSAAILGGSVVQPAHPLDATPRIVHRRVVQEPRARSAVELSFSHGVVPLPAPRPYVATLPLDAREKWLTKYPFVWKGNGILAPYYVARI